MWNKENNKLKATFQFKNFTEAFAFMTEVAFQSEQQNHHPNWSNIYNTVSFELNTHDAANTVTEKDHKLAEAIDLIYAKYTA